MNDPRRFSDGPPDDPAAAVFRSLRDDRVPEDAHARLLATLGLAGAAPVATAATSAVRLLAFGKWFGIGALVALGLLGVNELVTTSHAPASTPVPTPATPIVIAKVATTPTREHAEVPREPLLAVDAPAPTIAASAAARVARTPNVAPTEIDQAPTPDVAPPPEPVEAPVEEAAPVLSIAPPPAASAPVVVVIPTASASASGPTVADEIVALDAVRRALAGHHGNDALHLLDAYARAFPRGQMGAEATVLRVEALVQVGDRADATSLARSFVATHAESLLTRRVRALVGLEE